VHAFKFSGTHLGSQVSEQLGVSRAFSNLCKIQRTCPYMHTLDVRLIADVCWSMNMVAAAVEVEGFALNSSIARTLFNNDPLRTDPADR
jgi:hypothetical protein